MWPQAYRQHVSFSLTLKHRARGVHLTTPPRTVFSGIQPTGTPHLGNYLGALSNWVRLQNKAGPDDALLYCVVGLHAITVPRDPSQLRRDKLDALASLLAIGIDPSRSILYFQEDVQEHSELAWILGCLASIGRLSRMTAYKSKLASMDSSSNERLGLFSYPVLQAADVLLYKATHVPVGDDQRQHLELARDLAQIFNLRFPPATFPLPETISAPAKRLLSLRDPTQKMSKSALNPASRIVLSDSADEISQKIRKAVTDSNHNISYDPAARPGISNLLRILHECRLLASSPLSLPNPARSGVSIDTPIKRQIGLSEESHLIQEDNRDSESSVLTLAAALQSAGAQTPQFKEVVVEAVNAVLLPIRQEFTRYRADEAYLIRVAEGGAKRARAIAQQTMRDVKGKVGLGYL